MTVNWKQTKAGIQIINEKKKVFRGLLWCRISEGRSRAKKKKKGAIKFAGVGEF